jgi:hypothetical protein
MTSPTDVVTFHHADYQEPLPIDELHETNRGIASTTPAFAYVFRR